MLADTLKIEEIYGAINFLGLLSSNFTMMNHVVFQMRANILLNSLP